MTIISPIMPAGTIKMGPGVKIFPPRPLPKISPYAVHKWKTSRAAILAELDLAVRWKELAKSERHAARVPEIFENPGNTRRAPTPEEVEAVFHVLTDTPESLYKLTEVGPVGRTFTAASLRVLIAQGRAVEYPADRQRNKPPRYGLPVPGGYAPPPKPGAAEWFVAACDMACALLVKPMPATALGALMGKSKSTVQRILNELHNQGRIRKAGKAHNAVIWARSSP